MGCWAPDSLDSGYLMFAVAGERQLLGIWRPWGLWGFVGLLPDSYWGQIGEKAVVGPIRS